MPKSRKHLKRRGRRPNGKHRHQPNLAKFFERVVLTAGEASPHRVLYHYTNRLGAIGILTSQTFWSTAHDCTNDDAELISANAAVIAVAEECQKNATGGARQVLDIFLEHFPTSMVTDLGIVYLGCFSTARDDESQWRNYGENGSGVCLGVRVIEERGPVLSDRVSITLEVNYSETTLRQWLRETFRTICSALARAQSIRKNHEEGLNALYRIAAYASIKAKQEKWKSEQEVRLATFAPNQSRIAPSERKSSDGKIIRYLPVSVRADGKLIALDEIIIGSNQEDTERVREEFETLLAAKGYTAGSAEYPRITVSGVPAEKFLSFTSED
jgi:Protein of unknown function (DUF2971)